VTNSAIPTEQPVTPVKLPRPARAKLGLGQRIALAVVPALAAGLIRLLGMTLRYEDRAEPGVTPGYAIPGPVVFAFWHRSLLACAHRFRNLDFDQLEL
jgi:lysophospholipid acyltransferase (LPLAT)-like uncharacterized protein